MDDVFDDIMVSSTAEVPTNTTCRDESPSPISFLAPDG